MDSTLKTFLTDWSLALSLGGMICLFFGFFAGWIIWKNTRKVTESLESDNREALATFETASEEVSKVRAELIPED